MSASGIAVLLQTLSNRPVLSPELTVFCRRLKAKTRKVIGTSSRPRKAMVAGLTARSSARLSTPPRNGQLEFPTRPGDAFFYT
ncbi:hypothetical protein BV20DRAFT_8923 [Pilatotrama ljubarskyi]|nr:hypothetical protein BV20DRAFT_8923 [Pilatotrama ljubarskyi]